MTTKSPSVTLEEPLVRGDQKIEQVAIRRPIGGDLTGVSMRDVVNMEADAMFVLLPRITEPNLIMAELVAMNGADLLAISAEASNFLLPKAVRPASQIE